MEKSLPFKALNTNEDRKQLNMLSYSDKYYEGNKIKQGK